MEMEKDISVIKILNLGLAFALELVLLAISDYAGVTLGQSLPVKIILAITFPAALAVLWGIFLAPASKTRLRDPWLTAVKVLLFSLAAVFLFFTGLKGAAIGFGLITLLNLVLLYIYK
jgi:hypothetical protein